jgi:rhodanese-related sulfurtransferase
MQRDSVVRTIGPDTLGDWLADAEPVQVLDIRTAPEYELGHVPGSVNVPMASLTTRLDSLDLPRRVVLVCEVGELSIQAGRLVAAYEGVGEEHVIASLEGGYRAWESRERPV